MAAARRAAALSWRSRSSLTARLSRSVVVVVVWTYTGLSAPEMEKRITTYSEFGISNNVNNIAQYVNIKFDIDIDQYIQYNDTLNYDNIT